MPPQRLIRMLQHHTRGLVDGRSEISSWTHSFIAAVSFAQQIFQRDGKATIHIIDTAQIENDIIHNADIRRAFGNTDSITTLFPTEWIVHGVVDGPGHWLVKFRKIKSDLPSLRLKPAHPNGFPHMGFSERQAINAAMSAGRVKHDLASMSVTCGRVAATMMERYKAPDTPRAKMIQLRLQGMLYCLYPRFSRKMLKTGLDEKDHHAIIKATGDLTAAPELQKCLDIMEDDVFTHEDFPDVTQARLFLRLLATSREAARQVEEVSRQRLKRKRDEFEDEENGRGAWDKTTSSKTGQGGGIPGLEYLSSP